MIILSGQPVSTSHIYAYHCKFGYPSGYMNAKGKDIKKQYQDEMWKQRNGRMLDSLIVLEVRMYFKTKGKHDIDNFSKLILDAGNGILWEDDGQIQKLILEKYYDKENPRVELIIYPQTKT